MHPCVGRCNRYRKDHQGYHWHPRSRRPNRKVWFTGGLSVTVSYRLSRFCVYYLHPRVPRLWICQPKPSTCLLRTTCNGTGRFCGLGDDGSQNCTSSRFQHVPRGSGHPQHCGRTSRQGSSAFDWRQRLLPSRRQLSAPGPSRALHPEADRGHCQGVVCLFAQHYQRDSVSGRGGCHVDTRHS